MIQQLFEIIRPRINPQVLEVVHKHLTDEQIGLLLVKLINPYVMLTQQEEAVLRGVNRKTLRGMKSRGEVPVRLTTVGDVNAEELPFFTPESSKMAKKLPRR